MNSPEVSIAQLSYRVTFGWKRCNPEALNWQWQFDTHILPRWSSALTETAVPRKYQTATLYVSSVQKASDDTQQAAMTTALSSKFIARLLFMPPWASPFKRTESDTAALEAFDTLE